LVNRQRWPRQLPKGSEDVGIRFVRAGMAGPDIERDGTRMVADVRGVVAGGAGTVDHRGAERIVEARNVGDREGMSVEHDLPARDPPPYIRVAGRAAQALPRSEDREGVGIGG